jgi:hypothetical protein
MSKVRVVAPKVKSSFPSGLSLETLGFTYTASVGQAPRFSCNVLKVSADPNVALDLQSPEVCSYLGETQERFFNSSSNDLTDCSFTVSMDDLEVFFMKAKLNRVSYTWGLSAPSMTHEAQGAVGCLTGLVMGIYDPKKLYFDTALFYLKKDYKPSTNLSWLFEDVIKGIVARAEAATLPASTPQIDVVRELIAMRKKTNALYLPVLYQILHNSEIEFPALADTEFWDSHKATICNTIVSSLVNSPDGMSALTSLCAEFGLLFIPDTKGSGKLVRLDKLLEAEAVSVKLDAAQLSSIIGSSGYLPARAVRVTVTNPAFFAGSPKDQADGSAYGLTRPVSQWPKEADRGGAVGRVESVPPPTWLNCRAVGMVTDKVPQAKAQDLNAVGAAIEAVGEKLKAGHKATWDCLQDWARLSYIQEVLSSSALVIQMPSPDWETFLGKKVTFLSSKGGTLCTGLVTGETKVINGGEGPSVMSTFQLSYVVFPGFNPVT